MFFEIVWVIAGLTAAIPSIPQIIDTIKTKNVEGLSSRMFWIWAFWGICWVTYWWYLNSWQMMFFNTISIICSVTMLLLIKKYSKKQKKIGKIMH